MPDAPAPTSHEQAFREREPDRRAAPFDSSDAWTITLRGEVDEAAVTRLRHEMTDALTGYDHILVDLRDVSVLSTPMLALLCCALRRAHRPHARFVIADAAPAARRALQLCELPGVELHPRTATTWDRPITGRDHEELLDIGQLINGLHGLPAVSPL